MRIKIQEGRLPGFRESALSYGLRLAALNSPKLLDSYRQKGRKLNPCTYLGLKKRLSRIGQFGLLMVLDRGRVNRVE